MQKYHIKMPLEVSAIQFCGQDDFPLTLCDCKASDAKHIHSDTGDVKTVRPSDWAIFVNGAFFEILSHWRFTDFYDKDND